MKAKHYKIDFNTIRTILVKEFDIEEGTSDLVMLNIWNNSFKQMAESMGVIDRYMKNDAVGEVPKSMGGFMIADTTTEFGRWLAERTGPA